MYDLTNKKVWVAAYRVTVCGGVVRRLASEGCQVITAGREVLHQTKQQAVMDWMMESKPNGTPRKMTDNSRLHKMGWNNVRSLEDGIKGAYKHFLASLADT